MSWSAEAGMTNEKTRTTILQALWVDVEFSFSKMYKTLLLEIAYNSSVILYGISLYKNFSRPDRTSQNSRSGHRPKFFILSNSSFLF